MSFSMPNQTHWQKSKRLTDLYRRYGPWAVVSGASSRLGKAFCRHLASEGLNLILVSRRGHLIEDLATELTSHYQIQTIVLVIDLSESGSMEDLVRQTQHLEIGLWVCSAPFGGSNVYKKSEFNAEVQALKKDSLSLLTKVWQTSHLNYTNSRAGLLLMTTLGSFKGNSATAQECAANEYVVSLARELSFQIKSISVDVFAVAPSLLMKEFTKRAHPQIGLANQLSVVVASSLKLLGKSSALNPNWLTEIFDDSIKIVPKWGRLKKIAQVLLNIV